MGDIFWKERLFAAGVRVIVSIHRPHCWKCGVPLIGKRALTKEFCAKCEETL